MMTDEEAISAFSQATSLPEWIRAGAPLLKTSAASKAAKDSRFESALDRLLILAQNSSDLEQLRAIAFAWRLTSVSAMKSHRRTVIERLKKPFDEPSTTPDGLEDPDDRKNLFEALRHKDDQWVARYLVRSLGNEKDGVQVRGAAAETLVVKQTSLVESLEWLAGDLKNLRLKQKEPDNGRARLLIANLNAISDAIWNNSDDLCIGSSFGDSLKALVSSACRPGLADRDLKIGLVDSAISFYLKVARLEPSIASSAENYAFIRPLKSLFSPADWPDEIAPALKRLTALATQQLLFLLKLGRPDNELRSLILEIRGTTQGNQALLSLAANSMELSEGDRFWIERGRGKSETVSDLIASQSILARFDEDLGDLLRDSVNVSRLVESASNSLEIESELLPETLRRDLQRCLEATRDFGRIGMNLAVQRGLRLVGRVGEVVVFDPQRHNASPDAVGEKTVRLKSQPVEKILEGGKAVIVLKADVEKI